MSPVRRVGAILGIGLWVSTSAIGQPVSGAGLVSPKFGTQDQTVTVIPGLDFRGEGIYDLVTFSWGFLVCSFPPCPDVDQAHATLSLPAGAVIESIGVNTATTVNVPLSFSLYSRDHLGGTADLGTFSIPVHTGFATDYFDLADVQIHGNTDRCFMIVIRSPNTDSEVPTQFVGYVEVRWRRSVSDPPATPTFGDVPASHPFYQFIEALASSGITGGCGAGNYCPGAPLTRGQMAVFLSKALGLHWPL